MKKILNVLYQSDNTYAPVTGVSMASLMENNRELDEINIYVLNDAISAENIELMHICCDNYGRQLTMLETEAIRRRLADDFKVRPYHNTYTTYYKLITIKNLDINTDRILQLDGDTIINGSLEELCALDFEGCVMAACYDCIMNEYKTMIGIPEDDKYYNCGVVLFNQAGWRAQNCEEQIVHHLGNVRSKYFNVDQDILNTLFRKKTKLLRQTYNFNSGFHIYGVDESYRIYNLKDDYFYPKDEIRENFDNPVINHCMGAMTGRPWEKGSIHPQNSLFDKYLKISPWKDYEKITVSRDTVFKMQRLLYLTLPKRLYGTIHRAALIRYYHKLAKGL